MSDTPSLEQTSEEEPKTEATTAAEENDAGIVTLCPYCGSVNRQPNKCTSCGGLFDPLSLRATQVAMGPWQVRDKNAPFHPGFSYETLKQMVAAGRIKPNTVLRGPTTMQFWQVARNTPGVSHLLGICHVCNAPIGEHETSCASCAAEIVVPIERDRLGLQYPTEADAAAAQKRLEAEIALANGAAPASAPSPSDDGNADQAVQAATRAEDADPSGSVSQEDLLTGLFALSPDGIPADGQDWPAATDQAATPAPPQTPSPTDNPLTGTNMAGAWAPSATPMPVPQPEPMPAVASSSSNGMMKILIAVNAVLIVIAGLLIWLISQR